MALAAPDTNNTPLWDVAADKLNRHRYSPRLQHNDPTYKERKTMKVITTEKIPIKMWLDNIEDGALEQARNLANLPFAFKHIAIMPDSHCGMVCQLAAF